MAEPGSAAISRPAGAGQVVVVGIGDDGWAGLPPASRDELLRAEVVLGATRQLGLLPADVAARRVCWPSPLVPGLGELIERQAGARLCALASGDPMFFGLGSTLVRVLGAERVRVLPHPSSVSLACARLGWAVDATEIVSLVGRPLATVHPALTTGRRLLVLSADRRTPPDLCRLVTRRGFGDSPVTLFEHLGGPAERRREFRARDLADPGLGADGLADLNLLALQLVADPDARHLPRLPGLPDDVFEHDGQLTKREIRAVTLAFLAPAPGELLWDVGAGCGSVGIEWMRTHPSCRAVALEPRADRVERIVRNAAALGVPGLRVVAAAAPGALADLTAECGAPDAVFVGGGLTAPGTIERCWEALRPGGRIVANAVTIESEVVLARCRAEYGGELARLAVSRATAVGGFAGWRPMMPVTQWSATRPA
ncbi:precorrin-6Y C5,15-methyltransferase (decarboxylating) [Frankia sp. EI5c]|uniref:bifunctional cobalt-precorrin-7 (C(5))-methyltransferase/cobalt-precorrin-6B (C(15))-methyltransferase n=1 Tax=Frankia sp. EI5c TaxID=683316 RepID=UPI0007C26DA1|nr:bifunctional cobalt-precorrin-7 (C(5))-methyltransferase/cobalt-precorrin-6B (C(15))-methyltransferase [Frankia sp. EI5c]OAA28583.1 precorrin-6Y C5,15-methyltransferase (decarboxylating) [Frankia sp. EI5c]